MMEPTELTQFIQKVLPISSNKVNEIVSYFQPLSIKKNDFFIQKGKIANNYLFLEKGFIRAFTYDLEGNEVTTAFYSKHQMVFEVASFFQKIPSKENFQALEECAGVYINYEQLQVLFHSIPEFREFGRMILVNGFISFKERSISLINESAESRYETLLKSNPEIFQKSPLKYIASYLGITDTSLSRIRRDVANK